MIFENIDYLHNVFISKYHFWEKYFDIISWLNDLHFNKQKYFNYKLYFNVTLYLLVAMTWGTKQMSLVYFKQMEFYVG